MACTLGVAREASDVVRKGDTMGEVNEDFMANQFGMTAGVATQSIGIPCSSVCSRFRPRGLPPQY